jgi:hypothetical protein
MPSPATSAFAKLPPSVRDRISRVIGRSPALQRAVDAVSAIGSDGFVSMTPETLPAITSALELVRAEGLAGDYFEFGLYRGVTFLHAQTEAQRLGLSDIRFYGFDSFAGLPEIGEVDVAAGIWEAGDYACSRAEVDAYLTKYRAPGDYTLIEGFFDQSLTEELRARLQPRHVAVALIDCDLYASTVPVLEWLAQLLQPNCVLLFDDWNCADSNDEMGERRAFGEFLAVHKEWIAEPLFTFGWHGQAFQLRSAT